MLRLPPLSQALQSQKHLLDEQLQMQLQLSAEFNQRQSAGDSRIAELEALVEELRLQSGAPSAPDAEFLDQLRQERDSLEAQVCEAAYSLWTQFF